MKICVVRRSLSVRLPMSIANHFARFLPRTHVHTQIFKKLCHKHDYSGGNIANCMHKVKQLQCIHCINWADREGAVCLRKLVKFKHMSYSNTTMLTESINLYIWFMCMCVHCLYLCIHIYQSI